VVVGALTCSGEDVVAERSSITDCDPTPGPGTSIANGDERVVSSVLPATRTEGSTAAISVEVDTELSMELFTARVKAPAATTPAIEMVVAREVFIGITI
jgi:hypothetical protein